MIPSGQLSRQNSAVQNCANTESTGSTESPESKRESITSMFSIPLLSSTPPASTSLSNLISISYRTGHGFAPGGAWCTHLKYKNESESPPPVGGRNRGSSSRRVFGTPLDPRNGLRIFYSEEGLGSPLRFHDLRHSVSTLLLKQECTRESSWSCCATPIFRQR